MVHSVKVNICISGDFCLFELFKYYFSAIRLHMILPRPNLLPFLKQIVVWNDHTLNTRTICVKNIIVCLYFKCEVFGHIII